MKNTIKYQSGGVKRKLRNWFSLFYLFYRVEKLKRKAGDM